MDTKTFQTNTRKLVGQRNIFLLFSLLLLAAVLLQASLLFSKNEKVVVVPLAGNPYWIEKTATSQNYLEDMGAFLTELLLSRSPSDVAWRNQTLLKHVHPAFYHEMQSKLNEEKTRLTESGQSFVFHPEKSFVDLQTKRFSIEGESSVLIKAAGSKMTCAHSERKRYHLDFKCENGRLSLIALKQETL